MIFSDLRLFHFPSISRSARSTSIPIWKSKRRKDCSLKSVIFQFHLPNFSYYSFIMLFFGGLGSMRKGRRAKKATNSSKKFIVPSKRFFRPAFGHGNKDSTLEKFLQTTWSFRLQGPKYPKIKKKLVDFAFLGFQKAEITRPCFCARKCKKPVPSMIYVYYSRTLSRIGKNIKCLGLA